MNEQTLFAEALERTDPQARSAFLDQACRGNPALRERIDRLLAQHEHAGAFLESPPVPLGATSDEPATERPGTVIGAYKLLEQIGEGGFGIVFMAEQTEPVRRKVALKVIKPGMDTRQVIARFEAERQALAIMDHPNIAKVFDAGTTASGRPYFVMELVKGAPITEYCDQNQLTPRQRLELFILACQAVQHAHQKGIIHRDLKPSNVLISRHDTTPTVRVIDFGVAKALGQELTEKTVFTALTQMIGTPLYMSPEQAGMSDLDIDTRSDIYSLGVLLYELLTGTTPFTRERFKTAGYDEIRRIIREEEPPKPSTRLSASNDTLPSIAAQRHTEPAKLTKLLRGDLDWIVMKALEKDRNRRYETANSLALDVQRYLADEPVLAGPPSAWYRLRKFMRRNRRPVLAASIIVFVLLAGIVGTTLGMIQAVAAAKSEALARKQTRKAMNALTHTAVEDLLERQIQLTDHHRKFFKDVLTFHAEFAAAKADDPEGRQSQGEGYFQMGRIHWLLGNHKDAESAYANALTLQTALVNEFPDQPEYAQNLADIQANLGILLDETGRLKEAETTQRAALAVRKKLVNDFPDQATYQRDLARSYLNLGRLLNHSGVLKEVEDAYAEAVRLLKPLTEKFPSRNDYRENLASSYNNLANVLSTTGRRKAAEDAYGEALTEAKRLADDFPEYPDAQRLLAITYHNHAGRLRENGRFKDAETAYGEALKVLNRLVAEMPSRLDFRNDVATSLIQLGDMLSRTGRLTDAEAAVREASVLLKQLAAQQSTRPDFRHGLAASYLGLGRLQATTGRVTDAETAFQKASDLLTKLKADFPTAPRFRFELAASHADLATLLNSTGRPKQSEEAYGKALKLLKELTDEYPEHSFGRPLALWQNNLAYLLRQQKKYAEAEEFYSKALATRKQLTDVSPDRPDFQHDLAFTYNSLGSLRRDQGRLEEAEEFYRKGLTIEERLDQDFPNHRDFRQELGRIYSNLGLMLVDQKNFAGAKWRYARALAIDKQLVADWPEVSDYQNGLAITLVNVAIMHNHREEYATAISLIDESRPHHQAALKASPRNTTYRECYHTHLRVLAWAQSGLEDHIGLAVTADELARHGFDPANETFQSAYYVYLCAKLANKDAKINQSARKQLTKDYGDRALALLEKAGAFADKPAANFPAQAKYREQVAACYFELAGALSAARWPKEAEVAYLGAVAIQKPLADSFRNRPAYSQELARMYNALGVLRFTTGRASEADGPYRDALRVWEQLVAENDSVPDYRNGLAGALVNLGMVQNQLRDFAAAVPFLEQARPHHEAALNARPKNSTYRLFYRNNVRTLAQSYLGLGEHGRLATSADEMAHFGFDPANDGFLAACFVSRCVLLADKDAKLAEDTRKELKDRYAERALELLRQAVDRGYRSAAQMKAEPDLEPLRGREEFKKLIAEMEAKK